MSEGDAKRHTLLKAGHRVADPAILPPDHNLCELFRYLNSHPHATAVEAAKFLDENDLNETAGMCTSAVVPIDWNGDLQYTSGVVADVNNYGLESNECGGTNTILHDFNDWANLQLASVVTSYTSGGATRANMSALPAPASCAPIPSYPRGP